VHSHINTESKQEIKSSTAHPKRLEKTIQQKQLEQYKAYFKAGYLGPVGEYPVSLVKVAIVALRESLASADRDCEPARKMADEMLRLLPQTKSFGPETLERLLTLNKELPNHIGEKNSNESVQYAQGIVSITVNYLIYKIRETFFPRVPAEASILKSGFFNKPIDISQYIAPTIACENDALVQARALHAALLAESSREEALKKIFRLDYQFLNIGFNDRYKPLAAFPVSLVRVVLEALGLSLKRNLAPLISKVIAALDKPDNFTAENKTILNTLLQNLIEYYNFTKDKDILNAAQAIRFLAYSIVGTDIRNLESPDTAHVQSLCSQVREERAATDKKRHELIYSQVLQMLEPTPANEKLESKRPVSATVPIASPASLSSSSSALFGAISAEQKSKLEEYKNDPRHFSEAHLQPIRTFPASLIKLSLQALSDRYFGPQPKSLEFAAIVDKAEDVLDNLTVFSNDDMGVLKALSIALKNHPAADTAVALQAVEYFQLQVSLCGVTLPTDLRHLANPELERTLLPIALETSVRRGMAAYVSQ
jgi:hypothetical protein